MKWLLLIPGMILGLLLIALVRTLLMPGKKAEYTPQESEEESLRLAEKLSKMVQYDTTSHAGMPEPEKFRGFHKTLEQGVTPEQLKSMHGLNENIEYNCLPGAVRFYRNLILAQK